MTDKVEFCKNCKREIAVANFTIHSAHCERNIQLCSICAEPVPRNGMEQHLIDSHSREACTKCHLEVEKCYMERHMEEECSEKLHSCNFCELELPIHRLKTHVEFCGTRTETCSICLEHIMYKDLIYHSQNCQKNVVTKSHGKYEYSHIYPAGNAIASSSPTENERRSNKYDMKQDKEVRPFSLNFPDATTKRPKKCEFCQEFYPETIFPEHSAACGSQTEICSECNMYVMKKDKEMHPFKCKMGVSDTYGRCPVCRKRIPWVEMNIHSTYCAMSHDSFTPDEPSLEQKFHPAVQLSPPIQRKSDSFSTENNSSLSYSKLLKQCAFCKEKFPDLIFADHRETCNERPYNCKVCLKPMPFKDKQRHKLHCKTSIPNSHSEKDSNSSSKVVLKGDIKKQYLECLWCHKKILQMELDKHLKDCCHRMKKCNFCNADIPAAYEEDHLQSCALQNSKNNYQPQNRRKNRSNKSRGGSYVSKLVTSMFRGENRTYETPVVHPEYNPPVLPEAAVLPCEFCDVLFPEDILIEHQSGCRPDLVSFPKTKELLTPENAHTGVSFKVNRNPSSIQVSDKLEQKNPKISEKRDTLYRNTHASLGIKPGEFVENYDSSDQSGSTLQCRNNLVEEARELKNTISNMKSAANKSGSTLQCRNNLVEEARELRNTISNMKSAANKVCEHTPLKELKAVGAERAERRGIIQVSRDTVLNAKCDKNTSYSVSDNQMTGSSGNCYSKEDKNNSNLNKLNFSESIFSFKRDEAIPDSKNAVAKKIFSEECSNTDSFFKNNEAYLTKAYVSPPSKHLFTENDAKNDETFGCDPKNCDLESGSSTLSDTEDKFFDAEDWKQSSTEENNNKVEARNIKEEDSSSKDYNLDAYFEFLKIDKVEGVDSSNGKIAASIPTDCRCGNVVCYCSMTNQPFQLNEQNSFPNATNNFKGARPKKTLMMPDLLSDRKLEPMSSETLANLRNEALLKRREELQAQLDMGSLSKEPDLNSPAWKVWRNRKEYDTDSD